MKGPLLLALSSAALAVLAVRLSARLLPRASTPLGLLAPVVLFVALANGLLLVLGAAGWLAAGPVTTVSVLLLALELAASARGRGRHADAPSASGNAERAPLATSVAAVLLIGLFSWWAGRTLGSGTGFVWDDLAYHAAIPAWWAHSGSLELVPLTYQGYYPANAELLALWFVLPFGTDAVANATVLVWIALVILSCATIAHAQEFAALSTALAVACFAFSPQIGFFSGTYCANDLALAGLGTAMLAFAAPGGEASVRGRAFLSGLAAGLALGTKVSIAPQVVLVAIWWGSTRFGAGLGRKGLVAFLAGTLLAGGAWYVRNLVLTGNPIYPAAFGPLEGPLTTAAQRKTSLVPTILNGWSELSFWRWFLGRYLDWPLVLGFVSILGYGAGIAAALRAEGGPRRRFRLLLAGAGLLFVVLFPMQPFSGTVNRPTSGLHGLIRYLAWPFLLGLLLFATMARRRRAGLGVASLLAIAFAVSRPDIAGRGAWLFGGLGAALLVVLVVRMDSRRLRLVASVALACSSLAVVVGARALERASAERLYAFGEGRPVGQVWRALEELPAGARIASITHYPASHALYRPLFGRELQLVPVAVDQAGSVEPPLHERPPSTSWWAEFATRPPVKAEELEKNLRAGRVDFLLISRWPQWLDDKDRSWPAARAALRGIGGARRAYADDYSEIWDVRVASGATGTARDEAGD